MTTFKSWATSALLVLSTILMPTLASAQTGTVKWSLRAVGGAEIDNFPTQAKCDAAAKALNRPGTVTYECPRLLDVKGTAPAPVVCPATPAATTQTIACPSGTTGSWVQTTTWSTNAQTCAQTSTVAPSAAPTGACTTIVVPPVTQPTTGAILMSPTGTDSGDCKTTPCKTFAYTVTKATSGSEIVLADGVYTSAASWTGTGAGQVPSGTATKPTVVRAANPGKAIVPGAFIGRSTRKDSYIIFKDLTFSSGVSLYNTSFITLKNVGVYGGLNIGTNDHNQGNTDNLIEDVWVWAAQQRGIAVNYRGHRNVWRRVIVRGDGCSTDECKQQPNIGITVYDSQDVSLQNVIVIDRVLATGGYSYGDFANAQHGTDSIWYAGRNEWLGTLSINGPDQGYYFELDVGQTVAPTTKVNNAGAFGNKGGGFNIAREGTGNVLNNLTMIPAGDGAVRVAPEMTASGRTGTLTNVIVSGAGNWGINSSYVASNVAVGGTWSGGKFNQTTPLKQFAGDPLTSGLKYPVRIEAGSALAAAGFTYDVTKRYGIEGTRFGEPGYNTLSSVALWPWPNQDRIKAEMCSTVKRGFCADTKNLSGGPLTLTSYIWELMGNKMPE